MDLVLRAIVVFFLIFVITRVVGRRELGKLEPFDLIMLVVIGDLVQQGVTQSDNSVIGVFLVIGVICVLTVAMSYLGFRVPRARDILGGEPLVLVENGRPIERNLRRQRLTIEEVAAQARLQQIAHIADIRLAVLETSGDISVIPAKDPGSS
jgi:uncharacterized membrane protein YcaP (DUF421 family)